MIARALLIVSLVLTVGCEKTDHESIEKWRRTEKGPGKLKKALGDEKLDPDLSAHAGAVMISSSADGDVRTAFDSMSPTRKSAVLAKLVPRLWEMARIQREDALPAGPQIIAKDMLINLRKHGDDATRKQIDAYLVDWYGVMSYEGRAKVGSTLGSTAVRMIGPAAGKKLIPVLNGIIAAPGQEKTKIRIGDELMLGIAASGDPDGVKLLIDVAHLDRADPSLPSRAMNALRRAYVDPQGLFDMVDPASLKPSLPALIGMAKDEGFSGAPQDMAIELIRRVGAPDCLEPLVSLIGLPHPNPRFRYATGQAALLCGGAPSVLAVVRALPDGSYDKDELVGAIAAEIAKMGPRDQVLASLRQLLDDKGTVEKWVAMESLALMKSAEDAPRIAALAGAKDRLTGYWGDQRSVAAAERKSDPTLGDRAKELAAQLGAK